MTVMMPVPATVADSMMVMERIGHADMGAQTADMRARANAFRSNTGSRAYTANMGTNAHFLRVYGTAEQKCDCNY